VWSACGVRGVASTAEYSMCSKTNLIRIVPSVAGTAARVLAKCRACVCSRCVRAAEHEIVVREAVEQGDVLHFDAAFVDCRCVRRGALIRPASGWDRLGDRVVGGWWL
jgi:hypothetical protein